MFAHVKMPPAPRRRSYIALSACVTILICIASVPLVHNFLETQVIASIKREAEAKAVTWARSFMAQLPSIETIIDKGSASPAESLRIRDSIAVGEVFRFKIFDRDGHLAFVSDQAQFTKEGGKTSNEKALQIFQTGKSHVTVHDGRAKPSRPDTYVEAYIPAISANGALIGALEVYVDVSALEQVLRQSYSQTSLWLILGCALVFLTPAVALIWRGEQLRSRDRRVARLQRFDQLTGVLNRNSLTHEIDRTFSSRAPDETIGVLFVDVDQFKQVNDQHGHQIGDEILRTIANVLRSCSRNDHDITGRFGGDEFVVLYRSIDLVGLRSIVRRIQQALENAQNIVNVKATLSIGAHLSPPGEDQQAALHAADIAVYEAKRRGRDQMVEYCPEIDAVHVRRKEVEQLLTRAIDDALFELHFQPITDLKSREVLGFEALLRMNDSAGGLIPPNEFIPIAEKSGLMKEIGKWVLREAINIAQEWPNQLFVSVNLSVSQFESGDLPREVFAALNEFGFEASRLELEITESLLIEDHCNIQNQLQRLKDRGISIAIDDFGAGNTSIGHFWKFDFDKLKLDRSFLLGRQNDSGRYDRLLHAITAFANCMELLVVAEGIELDDDLEINAFAGVDQAQGFLLGRPMPADKLDQFLHLEAPQLAQAG